MKSLPFESSSLASLGVELEFQIIDPKTCDLISRAKQLIRHIQEGPYQEKIKPEITQGMIEINSSVHGSIKDLHEDLLTIRAYLLLISHELGVNISGGGTHPFRKWSSNKIFPTQRYKNLTKKFQYLSKRSTVFGQHVHIGCSNTEEAIYLNHALIRYAPHFIAINGSSPFYQGVDTHFHSTRSNIFSAYPTSGVIPYLLTWKEFSDYYYKMKTLGVINNMKDFYWDIRPKPEFGTVEVRVCDTPLTIKKAVILAAYIQTVSHYLLHERPFKISHDLYYIYGFNRFQASRYAYDGAYIDSLAQDAKQTIGEDIQKSIVTIEKSAKALNTSTYLMLLKEEILSHKNDSLLLRDIYKKTGSFREVVQEQCSQWKKD